MSLRLTAALLASLLSAAALAAPPTDEQVQALIDKVKTAATPTDVRNAAARTAAAKAGADAIHEGMKDVSLAEATVAQIDKLVASNVFAPNAEVSAALLPHLTELAKEPTRDGARAAELKIFFFTPYTPAPSTATAAEKAKVLNEWYEAMRPVLRDAIQHPAALESVKSGGGGAIFARVGGSPSQLVKADRLLEAVEPLLVPEMSLEAAASLGNIVQKAADPQVALEKTRKVQLLDKIAAAAEGPLAKPVPQGQERMAAAVRDTMLRARSAYLRGELLGGQAPSVPFSWCSDSTLKNLTDLKGTVTVVTFWATPYDVTVTNFPRLRELAARYRDAGSPVRIVGITSLQGRHIKRSQDPAEKPQRIDCANDPQKEYGLMSEFMVDMGVTWTIAFTPDGCFNPNFGVMGIPHFAIIDAAGRVRDNELRPGSPSDFKALADRIDALLHEGGLKAPERPMVVPPPPPPAPAPTPGPVAPSPGPAPAPAAPNAGTPSK